MIEEKKFREIAAIRDEHCVSIYIPTYRAGHVPEDKIRLKNALNEARDKLVETGMEKSRAIAYLQQGYDLLSDDKLWLRLSDGMAVFIAPDIFEYEIVPLLFNEFVHVGDRFYLSHLLPALNNDTRFFLLALSQNEVRFFECDQYSITPVVLDGVVPTSMEEALVYDGNESLQMHHGGGAGSQPIYHGQGSNEDRKQVELEEYFRLIDKGLKEILCDEDAPMVIASVEYLAPLYRKVSNYPNIAEKVAAGNPENTDPALLHEKAWACVAPQFETKQKNALEEFGTAMANDRASFALTDIVPAAINGRVDRLYVDKNYHVWGNYNPQDNTVDIHPERQAGDICLINEAAIQTFLQGGEVYLRSREEMPKPTASLNAVYRYSI